MKKWAAVMSMVLVLLSAGVARSQSAMAGPNSSAVKAAPRRPAPARSPMAVQPPGVVQHPGFVSRQGFAHQGFVQNPGFARARGFARTGRTPFWPGFVTNRIFFVRGGGLAPWPYWYNYPPPSYAPSLYWAYCQSPEGYFPYVQECPGGWVPVVPTPPAPEWWRSATDGDEQPAGATSTDDLRGQLARSRAESNRSLDVSLETAAGSRPSP